MLRDSAIFFTFVMMGSLFPFVCYARVPSTQTNVHDVKLEHVVRDWEVYTAIQDSHRLCYMVSFPINGVDKGAVEDNYLLVTYINKAIDEVSVSSDTNYYDNDVSIQFTRGKSIQDTYKLSIVESNVAWAKNIDLDEKIVNAMKINSFAEIISKRYNAEGSSEVSSKRVVKYSLSGFKQAYSLMSALCE